MKFVPHLFICFVLQFGVSVFMMFYQDAFNKPFGNVIGTLSIVLFMGIGIPWMLALLFRIKSYKAFQTAFIVFLYIALLLSLTSVYGLMLRSA